MSIQLQRVYQNLEHLTGQKILVDKLWPRGASKQQLQATWQAWLAPSYKLHRLSTTKK